MLVNLSNAFELEEELRKASNILMELQGLFIKEN